MIVVYIQTTVPPTVPVPACAHQILLSLIQPKLKLANHGSQCRNGCRARPDTHLRLWYVPKFMALEFRQAS
jgi:hypothetical protein